MTTTMISPARERALHLAKRRAELELELVEAHRRLRHEQSWTMHLLHAALGDHSIPVANHHLYEDMGRPPTVPRHYRRPATIVLWLEQRLALTYRQLRAAKSLHDVLDPLRAWVCGGGCAFTCQETCVSARLVPRFDLEVERELWEAIEARYDEPIDGDDVDDVDDDDGDGDDATIDDE